MQRQLFPSLLLLLALAPAAAAADLPVVVAVDTSRSLQPSDVTLAADLVRGALNQVDGGSGGVLSFDDEPRWVVPLGTPLDRLAQAVGGLQPQGDFTLLYDALFAAARALEGGGVVVVVTDGRDENSATTVEDVAGLCRERGIRLLTVGSGRGVAERSLRRLALLTDGRYLGQLTTPLPAAELATAILAARVAPALEPAAARPAAGERVATEMPAVTEQVATDRMATTGETARSYRWMVWLGFAALAVLVGGAAISTFLRRRSPRPAHCRVCGSEQESKDAECKVCLADELQARFRNRPVVRLEDTAEFDLSAAEVAALSDTDIPETTRVLKDQDILVVQEPGERPRNYLLRQHAAFGVGRDPEDNTISLSDPALSSQHFKIVPEEGRYYLVDLGSTNGTFLNRERVRARQLRSGDVIHAGQADFEFRSYVLPV